MTIEALKQRLEATVISLIDSVTVSHGELTIVVKPHNLKQLGKILKEDFQFEQLIDLAGVDYSRYGLDEWKTDSATATGFSRGAEYLASKRIPETRFAVVYHLLSLHHNHRLRMKVFVGVDNPRVESVVDIWASASWYEREAFDLFGILFDGHPDLRRILTDYGFIGHPFRKDFPISGHVEMRYDANLKRIVYGPVEIDPRVNVPRVIRHDNRYTEESK
jgi:NADH-quinone oxidoreductase subunit C